MGILHEKLNLVNALFHDPGQYGIDDAHSFNLKNSSLLEISVWSGCY
jgi:hypothetical protein